MSKHTTVKSAAAPAVPFADSNTVAASTSPVPPPSVGNKPAPGQKGPKGLAPRTNYSRVNTGAPPVADAGSVGQKSVPVDPMNMLPQKVASEVSMSLAPRKTLQEMIKAAAAGVQSRVALSDEAIQQLGHDEETKTAAEKPRSGDSPSSLYVDKLAAALEWIAETKVANVPEAGSETMQGPGDGPNALGVMQAESSETNVDAGQQGQAKSDHIPPKDPPQQKDPSRSSDPGTGMTTNDAMQHGEQPVDPMGNDRSVKTSSAPIELIRKLAAAGKPAKGGTTKQASSVDLRLVDAFLSHVKQAEDAINPAQISGGKADATGAEPPPGASASEEKVPNEPSDVNSQKSMIASNDAAIDYTKGEAKADPKSDANKVLSEPALSAAHDKTLEKNLDHTGEAGVKISSAVRTAATRALLEKLAQEADEKEKTKKEKSSMGGMGTYQAPPVGGAAGSA